MWQGWGIPSSIHLFRAIQQNLQSFIWWWEWSILASYWLFSRWFGLSNLSKTARWKLTSSSEGTCSKLLFDSSQQNSFVSTTCYLLVHPSLMNFTASHYPANLSNPEMSVPLSLINNLKKCKKCVALEWFHIIWLTRIEKLGLKKNLGKKWVE